MRATAFASRSFRGHGYPPPKPTLAHSAYGQFTITNYDPMFTYDLVVSAGSATRSGAVITLDSGSVNATLVVTPRFGPAGTAATAERRAYTYHTENHQTCYNNCQPGGGPSGANSCWCGTSTDGYATCCGGCYGQTCSGDPNAIVKDSTPTGFTDSMSEWWKVS